jgi:hypothetical protein
LINSLNRKGSFRRLLAILAGFLKAYLPATFASIAAAVMVGLWGPGWFTAVLLLVILLVVSIGIWVYLDITRNVVNNGFGLCTGLTEEAKHEALTPWLHKLIQGKRPLNDAIEFPYKAVRGWLGRWIGETPG